MRNPTLEAYPMERDFDAWLAQMPHAWIEARAESLRQELATLDYLLTLRADTTSRPVYVQRPPEPPHFVPSRPPPGGPSFSDTIIEIIDADPEHRWTIPALKVELGARGFGDRSEKAIAANLSRLVGSKKIARASHGIYQSSRARPSLDQVVAVEHDRDDQGDGDEIRVIGVGGQI